MLVGRLDQFVEQVLALGRVGDAASSLLNPSRTAPSRPIPPISPVGQATVNSGAWNEPPAMAIAPSP
jgi:hypothetical protein